MQQHLAWLLFALLVLSPAALALLVDRLGAGRWVSLCAFGAAVLAVAGVLSQAPTLIPGYGEPASNTVAPAPPPRGAPPPTVRAPAPSPPGKLTRQQQSLQTELRETVDALKKVRMELEAERNALSKVRLGASEPRSADGALEAEKAAHARTRASLAALTEQAEAQRKELVESLRQARFEAQAARQQADEATRRLVIAEASITRLEAASRGVAATREAAALPSAPAPFSSAAPAPVHQPTSAAPPPSPVLREPAAKSATAESAAAPATEPAPAAPHPEPSPSDGAEIRRKLEGGLIMRQIMVEKVASGELIRGRRGSYYRIACRSEGTTRRIAFEAGAFTVKGGDGPIEACFRVLRQNVLDALPASVATRLYAQGFASPSGFVKPQRMPAGSEGLATTAFLPRLDEATFSDQPTRQAVEAAGFANKELPVLRAAHVGRVIERMTQGRVKPELLEGAYKPSADEASRGFDLVLFVAW